MQTYVYQTPSPGTYTRVLEVHSSLDPDGSPLLRPAQKLNTDADPRYDALSCRTPGATAHSAPSRGVGPRTVVRGGGGGSHPTRRLHAHRRRTRRVSPLREAGTGCGTRRRICCATVRRAVVRRLAHGRPLLRTHATTGIVFFLFFLITTSFS
ncbi:hypothetical protein GGR56DRAFT_613730 [Xylariaceae sp. FL0804]|nr:hypothetical protein GGR56DRAFT_613730 [Xylariaceae sp. FL0804]